MKLPRYRTKSLLIAITVVAVWLSALSGYRGSSDVLAFMWTAIVVMSGVAAFTYSDRRRLFWLGFFGTMLLASLRATFHVFGSRLRWTQELSQKIAVSWRGEVGGLGQLIQNINTSLIMLTMVASATAIGFLCVFIFDQSKQKDPL